VKGKWREESGKSERRNSESQGKIKSNGRGPFVAVDGRPNLGTAGKKGNVVRGLKRIVYRPRRGSPVVRDWEKWGAKPAEGGANSPCNVGEGGGGARQGKECKKWDGNLSQGNDVEKILSKNRFGLTIFLRDGKIKKVEGTTASCHEGSLLKGEGGSIRGTWGTKDAQQATP